MLVSVFGGLPGGGRLRFKKGISNLGFSFKDLGSGFSGTCTYVIQGPLQLEKGLVVYCTTTQ